MSKMKSEGWSKIGLLVVKQHIFVHLLDRKMWNVFRKVRKVPPFSEIFFKKLTQISLIKLDEILEFLKFINSNFQPLSQVFVAVKNPAVVYFAQSNSILLSKCLL